MTRLYRENPPSLASSLAHSHPPRRGKWLWLWGLVLGLGLAGGAWFWHQTGGRPDKALVAIATKNLQSRKAPPLKADCRAPSAPLQRDLAAIAGAFDGTVGIAVAKAGCDWVVGERANEFFPQQSVSKLWVSLAVLDAVDHGTLKLDDPVTIAPSDLTVLNQPLRQEVLEQGSISRPVRSLMHDALSLSDNTANDRLLWTVGGPNTVRAMLHGKGITGIRFGPGERLLQSGIAGLRWSQELSLGSNFYQARARLPSKEREAALNSYLANPVDGAMPSGIARALAGLVSGQLLSPESTEVMLDILSRTHSGPMRLKAGAPAGWAVYHKTGTGQELGRMATGYNDVGILKSPDGAYYAVAVMIRKTTVPIPVRMQMMQTVSGAIARFHNAAAK